MTRRIRFSFAAVVLAVLAACASASSAAASSTQTMFVEAPRDLTAVGATAEHRATSFAQLQSLGVRAIRVNLRWRDVAPESSATSVPEGDLTDPARYGWGNYALTIDEATRRGWQVLVTLSTPAPQWATEGQADAVTNPSASEYRRFATAAARRFGAPTVLWSVLNEPNLKLFLKPQLTSSGPGSAQIYRALYVAGRQGIRDGGQTAAKVLFGELAAVGGSSDGRRYPLEFLRSALCLSRSYAWTRSCGKLEVDGVAIHPYQIVAGKARTDDVTASSMSRLPAFLDRAAKAGAINAKVPVYVTEFGIQSWPDKIFGVSPQRQVEARARVERNAFYMPRVRAFSQYLLTDDDTNGGFQTGLLYAATGKPKPSFEGMRLVLDARPSRRKISLWGLVRPANGTTKITVERKTGKRFTSWRKITTKANGSFTLSDRARTRVQYRYRWTAPDGTVFRSAPVRPLKG